MTAFDLLVAGADRAVFGNLGGEVVTYSPSTGTPFSVVGVFDAQYVLAKGSAHAGVEAAGPAIFFRLSDLLPSDPEAENRATIAIRGNIYRVIEARPDGVGGIVLVLRRVN